MEKFRIKSNYKRHILIVDDEIINREIIGNFLQSKYDAETFDWEYNSSEW